MLEERAETCLVISVSTFKFMKTQHINISLMLTVIFLFLYNMKGKQCPENVCPSYKHTVQNVLDTY